MKDLMGDIICEESVFGAAVLGTHPHVGACFMAGVSCFPVAGPVPSETSLNIT